jgi:hypothetical protein
MSDIVKLVGLVSGNIVNLSLQSVAYVHLNKFDSMLASQSLNNEISAIKKILIFSILINVVAVIALILAIVLIVLGRGLPVVNGCMVMSGVLLLVSGSFSANIAIRLQCLKSDEHLALSWSYTSISAIIGILGTIVLLAVQALENKNALKKAVVKHLTTEQVSVPTYTYDPTRLEEIKKMANNAEKKQGYKGTVGQNPVL